MDMMVGQGGGGRGKHSKCQIDNCGAEIDMSVIPNIIKGTSAVYLVISQEISAVKWLTPLADLPNFLPEIRFVVFIGTFDKYYCI